jgi:hypothetical protein
MYFCSFILYFLLFLLLSCSNLEIHQPKEIILATIGDKTISVNEFKRRAEYTVRPAFCRGNNYIHKKIILNSLIAEKLLSLEAGDKNEFTTNERLLKYLNGRQEQVMRQMLYNAQGCEKVVLDTAKIIKIVGRAGRKYTVEYVNLNDSIAVLEFWNQIKEGVTPDKYEFYGYPQDTIPTREVCWDENEHDIILDALYSEPVKKNQIIGPLKIETNQYLILKVLGWIDQPAITDKQYKTRWRDISNRLAQQKAWKIFRDYIRSVMKGKSIVFESATFSILVDLIGPHYLNISEEKKEVMKKDLWKNGDEIIFDSLKTDLKRLYKEPFFKVNDQTWTVEDFIVALRSHPLVFRKNRIAKKEFAEQFKFAIIDMITDTYLTKEAYKKGYDKVNVVQRNKEMWKDYINSLYQKSLILEEMDVDSLYYSNYTIVIKKYLNPLINRLQQKYSDVVEINFDEFEKIKLSRIDMVVVQKKVPFPIIVPAFPLLTTDNLLDYGKKMETKNM